jgi:hypothetical protein
MEEGKIKIVSHGKNLEVRLPVEQYHRGRIYGPFIRALPRVRFIEDPKLSNDSHAGGHVLICSINRVNLLKYVKLVKNALFVLKPPTVKENEQVVASIWKKHIFIPKSQISPQHKRWIEMTRPTFLQPISHLQRKEVWKFVDPFEEERLADAWHDY